MYNQTFVKAFQISDLFSPVANPVSVPESELLARNSRVIWVVIAAMSIATIAGYWAAGLSLAWSTVQAIGLGAVPCLVVAYCYRRLRPDVFVSFTTESFAQLLLVLTLGGALSYPLATIGFPYCDELLHGADAWMGLDWLAHFRFVSERPLLSIMTLLAYDSVLLQLVVLLVVLVPTRRFVRFQQFVLANAIGLCIALVVFTFMPAAGTYSFLQVGNGQLGDLSPVVTADQKVFLDALRSGKQVLVDEMSGLITFPSFHAEWAIFFMWAFYPVKRLRAAAILLNLAVLASTPVQGAHYFIDLVGGLIAAGVSIYGAVWLTSARPQIRRVDAASCPPEGVADGTQLA